MTGIHDEASDAAMNLVDMIESILQGDGVFSYAPDGTPCLTWKGRQRLGHLLDLEFGNSQNDAGEALRCARETRLGQSAHLGKLPDRLFAAMMDGEVHSVHDLCLARAAGETNKQIYNAIAYLVRHKKIERMAFKQYRVCRSSLDPQV